MTTNHQSPYTQSQRPLPLEVWGATDKGRQREGNEDAIFPHSGSDASTFEPGSRHLAQQGQLLIVADGVGGAQGGREASHWAIRVAVERYYDMAGPDLGIDLQAAIQVANSSLYQYIQSTGARESGCTMAAAVIHGNTLYVANVGDSRVYLLRNGKMSQLTHDHTLAQQKADRGIIQPDQVDMDPGSHVLVRSMGSGQTVQVDLFPPFPLVSGDVVLLCSDGLTDMLADAEIAKVLGQNSAKRATQRLIAAANKNGGVDNISVVVARVDAKQVATGQSVLDSIRQMPQRQKTLLLAGAVAVAAVLIAALGLGWWMSGQSGGTPTPLPPTIAVATPPPATLIATVPPAEEPTATTDMSDQVTSTPKPTNTPTHTPPPPPPDADNDGILDNNDDCPNRPGTTWPEYPDSSGCPDNDVDSIPEPPDACPEKPGQIWPGYPASNGCPDQDGDGVPEPPDTCPDYIGSLEDNGCPPDDGGGGGDSEPTKPAGRD